MNTYSTCQLGDPGDRGFYFLTGSHDQVGEFIHNHHDIGKVFMSIIGVQLSFDEFFIIFFNVSYLCHFEQVVTAVHFNTQGVERIDYFSGLGDDRFFFIRQFGQEMFFYDRIDTELYFFRIDHHKLQLGRVFLVKQ